MRNKRLFGTTGPEVGNPSHPGKKKISRKIAKLRREGKPEDQAVAIAHSMSRRGDL